MVSSAAPVPKGVYLLYGKEGFLKKEFIQGLRSEFFASESNSGMGFEQFNVSDQPLSALVDFLQNASFFASRKMAVLWGIDELEAEDRQKLLTLAEALPNTATLLLVSEESNIKKDIFLKNLLEKARPIPCHLPFDKDLPQWVEHRAKKFGKTMEKGASLLLIERAGKDAALLSSAVEQLSIYVGQAPRIALKDAEALLGRSVQADAFRLSDLLLDKKLKSALENLEVLLREGARIYEIIGALTGQIERLNKARGMMDEGFPDEAVQAELKLHPFFAGRLLEQAKKAPKSYFQKILKEMLQCDEAVKTGQLSDRLALQELFLRICFF